MLARAAGFSVAETRAFVTNYPVKATPSARWREMAERKLAELDALTERLTQMKAVLNDSFRCDCHALDECERLISAKPARRSACGVKRSAP